MAGITAYVFVTAGDEEAAGDYAESWLEEYLGREFYDGYEVTRAQIILADSLPPEYIDKTLSATEEALQRNREEAEAMRKAGNRQAEGRAHGSCQAILCEMLCEDMPWFNVETGDWYVPGTFAPRSSDEEYLRAGRQWYAVPVVFQL